MIKIVYKTDDCWLPTADGDQLMSVMTQFCLRTGLRDGPYEFYDPATLQPLDKHKSVRHVNGMVLYVRKANSHSDSLQPIRKTSTERSRESSFLKNMKSELKTKFKKMKHRNDKDQFQRSQSQIDYGSRGYSHGAADLQSMSMSLGFNRSVDNVCFSAVMEDKSEPNVTVNPVFKKKRRAPPPPTVKTETISNASEEEPDLELPPPPPVSPFGNHSNQHSPCYFPWQIHGQTDIDASDQEPSLIQSPPLSVGNSQTIDTPLVECFEYLDESDEDPDYVYSVIQKSKQSSSIKADESSSIDENFENVIEVLQNARPSSSSSVNSYSSSVSDAIHEATVLATEQNTISKHVTSSSYLLCLSSNVEQKKFDVDPPSTHASSDHLSLSEFNSFLQDLQSSSSDTEIVIEENQELSKVVDTKEELRLTHFQEVSHCVTQNDMDSKECEKITEAVHKKDEPLIRFEDAEQEINTKERQETTKDALEKIAYVKNEEPAEAVFLIERPLVNLKDNKFDSSSNNATCLHELLSLSISNDRTNSSSEDRPNQLKNVLTDPNPSQLFHSSSVDTIQTNVNAEGNMLPTGTTERKNESSNLQGMKDLRETENDDIRLSNSLPNKTVKITDLSDFPKSIYDIKLRKVEKQKGSFYFSAKK